MYGLLENLVFLGAMQRCRKALLAELPETGHVLLLGEGPGAFLQLLLRQRPQLEIEVLDASERMLARARRRVGATDAQRLRWSVGDALTIAPQRPSYQAVVCCFFLDSFAGEDLARLLRRIDSWLAPGARLLVSDFRQASSGLAALRSRLWLRLLYSCFGLATGLQVRELEDPGPYLEQLGLQQRQERRIAAGLMWARSFARRE
ncbi:MAG: hypothetical protein CSA62_08680 [Planctomycetota bacterium]|nr:MAG: hypothetical protein CSA62_08680 [Planctomycetota bacterium]